MFACPRNAMTLKPAFWTICVYAALVMGTQTASCAPEAKDVVEISFLGPGGPIAGSFDEVVRAFERLSRKAHEADPSQPIYRVVSGQDASYDMTGDPTRFLISIAGGEPPDVVKFDRFAVAEWSSRNAFYPLDEFVARSDTGNTSTRILKEDYYPNTWAEPIYMGKLYAIPMDVDSRVLIYNKDLLKRAGFADAAGEARPPRTWDELRHYANKLTVRNALGRIETLGFAPNYGNSWLYMFGFMNKANFMSTDGRTCLVNEPPVIEALTYMRDIYDDLGGYGAVQGFQQSFQGGFLDPFVTGKVAMKIDSSWGLTQLALYGRDVDFGTAEPPQPAERIAAGDPPISWSGGFSLAIPVNARHKEAAWKFIRFAASDEGLRIYAEAEKQNLESVGYPYVPSFTPKPRLNTELLQKYVYSDPQISRRMKEGITKCLELLPFARYRPVTPVAQLMWSQQVSAMEDAFYHRKTPQEALDYARVVIQRDLDRALNPPPGTPFRMWWFYSAYGALLLGAVTLGYLFDTNVTVRRKLLRLAGHRKAIGEGDIVEGARGGYFRDQWRAGFLCAFPWLLGFVALQGGPLLFSMLMSFCDYDVLTPPRFTGLLNYKLMFTEDELVPVSLWNTVYMLIRVPLGMVAGLALAMLLDLRLRGISWFRTIYYVPTILPAVAAYILWIWIFNPATGPLNSLLAMFGIAGPNWLHDANWSKPSLVLMSLWSVGGGMIIWLAGLRSINPQLYEAAAIDGASSYRKFLHITLPQLSPYIFFNLVMNLIAGFKIFDEAFIMTHGGPVNSTLFYVYHLFNNAFRYGHMGYACAMAWVLFLIIVVFTAIQMKIAKRWVYYEHE
jgi:ABC-type sugar transport system permease subunit/ABC-type glycerol-3-phosphate transport system substrate-binding protein